MLVKESRDKVVLGMGMVNPYRAYIETEVNTASQGRLVLMLYNGTIRFINEAKVAVDQGRIEDAHNKVLRALDIVTELQANLDEDAGGDVAHNLYGLYDYISLKLTRGNVKKDVRDFDAALAVLIELRNAWASIVASGAGSTR